MRRVTFATSCVRASSVCMYDNVKRRVCDRRVYVVNLIPNVCPSSPRDEREPEEESFAIECPCKIIH